MTRAAATKKRSGGARWYATRENKTAHRLDVCKLKTSKVTSDAIKKYL